MKKIINRKSVLAVLAFIVFAVPIAVATYFYFQYQMVKKNPDLIAKEEVKSVTTTIRRYMDLPEDEEPTLATVTDKEKLKDQEFFKNSQNNDKVLIYTKSHKAILYRPSTNRVINFAPLTFGAQPTATTNATLADPIKVAIYNGTKTTGLSAEYEKKLTGITGVSVVSKSNAAKNDYSKTQVIDITGKNKTAAAQLTQFLGGELAEKLPDGEAKPSADVLIIVGR